MPRFCWFDLAEAGCEIRPITVIFVHTIGRVLVQHERTTGLNLSLEDSVPEFLGLNGLTTAALPLIPFVQLLELVTPDLMQAGGFVRAEQSPLAVRLDTLHATIDVSIGTMK